LTNGNLSDFRAWRRWWAISVVRGGGRDAQDDAVAVLDLERQTLSKRAMLDRYLEGPSIKGVARIDDCHRWDVILTVYAARGIKKIPRLMRSAGW
jgi:hypothetical protein